MFREFEKKNQCAPLWSSSSWKSIWLEGSFSESGDWCSSESGEFESSEGSAAIEGLLKKLGNQTRHVSKQDQCNKRSTRLLSTEKFASKGMV